MLNNIYKPTFITLEYYLFLFFYLIWGNIERHLKCTICKSKVILLIVTYFKSIFNIGCKAKLLNFKNIKRGHQK